MFAFAANCHLTAPFTPSTTYMMPLLVPKYRVQSLFAGVAVMSPL